MLSNSINWLIDCKKAQTSRQPQSCTRQPSWPGACADVSVCRALAVAPRGRGGGGGGERIVAGCPLLSQARMFDSPHWQNSRSHHNRAWNHSTTSKNGGKPTVIMLMFVDPPHLTSLSVPVPKVADMTRHTPPHISACLQTCHRAGYHGNYCFYRRLRLMLWEWGTWLGGNTVNRRMEEDMALVFVFVCPIIPALFIWDDFDSHNVCSQDSQPRCDHREMKRGFLLTFTLTTSPSDSIFFLPHYEFLVSVSLPLHPLLPPPCALFLVSKLGPL